MVHNRKKKKDPFLMENVFYLQRAERLSALRKRRGDQLEHINEKHDNTKEVKGSRRALTREADVLTQKPVSSHDRRQTRKYLSYLRNKNP